MKKLLFIIIACAMLAASGCNRYKKDLYLPHSDGDKIFTTVGTEQNTSTTKAHDGDGYYISVPDTFRYEKDYDDGAIEETWEHKSYDDIKINVTTYKNSDEITARGLFLREHDDYVFEDLLGYPLCGTEKDGDTLWFNLYEENGNVYIVSFEYDKNTKEKVITELSDITGTFRLKDSSTKENGEAHELIVCYDGYSEYLSDIYLCDDVYRSENTPTHGSGSILLPMSQSVLELRDYDILLCRDGCEPEAVLSRASQGYAPAYYVVPDGELYGNFKVLKFKMVMPEPMIEDIKKQGVYDLVTEQLERSYYYLIELDENHYAYIHLERKEGAEKTEDEPVLADTIVKNAKISFDSEYVCGYPTAK